jgi:hypothetical protein
LGRGMTRRRARSHDIPPGLELHGPLNHPGMLDPSEKDDLPASTETTLLFARPAVRDDNPRTNPDSCQQTRFLHQHQIIGASGTTRLVPRAPKSSGSNPDNTMAGMAADY